jgi:hypothetical protein
MKKKMAWKGFVRVMIPFIFVTVLFFPFSQSCQKEEIVEPENVRLKSATTIGVLTFFTTPEEFPCTGLPMEDFEEANTGVFPLMANPLDNNTSNHIFSTGEILPGLLIKSSTDNADLYDLLIANSSIFSELTSLTVITQHSVNDYLIIQFADNNVTNVSMKVINLNDANVNIEIFGTSGSLGTTAVYATAAGTYLGVQAEEPIKEIHLNGIYGQGEGVDDISFGTCNPDSDGDGCQDSEDAVVDSNMEEFITIDGCSNGVQNRMTLGEPCGTMMSDAIDVLEAGTYRNHGQFIKLITQLTKMWMDEGLITQEEQTLLLTCAGQSSIGSKNSTL